MCSVFANHMWSIRTAERHNDNEHVYKYSLTAIKIWCSNRIINVIMMSNSIQRQRKCSLRQLHQLNICLVLNEFQFTVRIRNSTKNSNTYAFEFVFVSHVLCNETGPFYCLFYFALCGLFECGTDAIDNATWWTEVTISSWAEQFIITARQR